MLSISVQAYQGFISNHSAPIAIKNNTSFIASSRLTLPVWQYPTGAWNTITDVPGVKVGHNTIRQDVPQRRRTGMTAILPHDGNLATEAVFAAASVLNGNGELTGLASIEQSGLLNSPIVLTNTTSVGAAHLGVHDYMQQKYGNQWSGQLPVVGECWDGVFNTLYPPLSPKDAVSALEASQSGPLALGTVGAGTGMRSFELHAGIGSASRVVTINNKPYTVGVLVNANHSHLATLDPMVRQVLETQLGNLDVKRQRDNQDSVWVQRPASRQGSIIVIIATDAPLLPSQLKQLANRAALGIGRMGSTMDTTSGDFALAFSTAQRVPVGSVGELMRVATPVVHPDALSGLQRATVEAVTEAQMRALTGR